MTECRSAQMYVRALAVAALSTGIAVGTASAQVAVSKDFEPVSGKIRLQPGAPKAKASDRFVEGGKAFEARLLDPAMVGPLLEGEPGVRGACGGVDCPARADNGFRSELDPAAPVRAADNFSLAAAAAPTSICFWGVYGDNMPPATETFTVTILNDAGGVPGTAVFSQSVTTGAGLTRIQTGRSFGDPAINEFQYDLDLTGAPVLPAGACHWLEITHDGSNPGGWFWVVTNSGDGRFHQITDLSAPYSNFNEISGLAEDLAWCFDVARNQDSGCAMAAPDAVCTQVDGSASCQFSDMTSGGFVSDDAPSAEPDGLADIIAADDFQVPAGPAQSVTELCWGGFYFGGGTQPDEDSFLIEFYNDANGAPGTVIASLLQGPDFTVTRGWSGEFQGGFYYSTTFAPGTISLPGGQCYWISIRNAALDSKWLWLTSIEGNGVIAVDTVDANGVPAGWTPGDRLDDPADLFFCLGFNIVPFGGCAFNPATPDNDSCSAATSPEFALTVDGPTITGTNVGAFETSTFDGVEPCGLVPLAPNPDVWFSVRNTQATARDLTVSTNFSGTNFDTVMNVLCAGTGVGACGSEAWCVGGNDDTAGNTVGQSAVTFTAAPMTTYLIRIAGFGGDQGTIEIGATSVAATGPAHQCVECEIPTPATATFETEPCDESGFSEANFLCEGITQTVPVPGRWFGSLWAQDGLRDVDSFAITLAQPTDVLITLRHQTPIIFQVWNNAATCVNQTNVLGFLIPPSCDGTNQITVTLPAGTFEVTYAPSGTAPGGDDSFEGVACGTYGTVQIDIEEVPQGECCLPGGDCVEVSEAICGVNDGVYGGDNTTCAGPTCSAEVCACEFDNDANQVNVFDLLAYLDLWFVNAAGADIDGVAGVDVFDLLFFLDCWFPASAGTPCP